MKKKTNRISLDDTSPRTFTYDQLSQISDVNYEVLNRCIDMSIAHADDIFVLYPAIIFNEDLNRYHQIEHFDPTPLDS